MIIRSNRDKAVPGAYREPNLWGSKRIAEWRVNMEDAQNLSNQGQDVSLSVTKRQKKFK